MKLTDVTFAYEDKVVLQNVSLDIPSGSMIKLVGASGLGKTTLLRGIAGLLLPICGTMETGGERFGMVFQENRLISQMSARNNLLVVGADFGAASKATATTLLEALFCEEQLAQVLSEKEPVTNFSGGMQRRIALARALYADNTCLLLDEAFTGLDAKTKHHVMEVVMQYRRRRTIILATHDKEVLDFFPGDRILLKQWCRD